MLNECLYKLPAYFSDGYLIRMILLVIIGIPLVRYVSGSIRRVLTQRTHAHAAQIIGNIVWYAGLTFIIITLLHDAGFSLSPLLGAAGVVGIAVGFAAKTTMSNIISGIFLLMEQSFHVNDRIVYSSISGTIEAIDLLSIKLRMADGSLVRIPNEALINNVMKNNTYFPHMRLTFKINVHAVYDVDKIFEIIHTIIKSSDVYLKHEKNSVLLDGRSVLAASSHNEIIYMNDILVHLWVKHENSGVAAEYFITHMCKTMTQENIEGTIKRVTE